MKLKPTLYWLSLIFLSYVFISWGETGHRIISFKSSFSYNQEMDPFWEWTNHLIIHASDPDYRRKEHPEEAFQHYIDIDNYPEYAENGKIAMDYKELVEKHGEPFVKKQGTLPWTTINTMDSLTRYFSEKNWEKAAFFAADLGHWVADGHMPLHISGNYDGQLTGNKGIHGRYESVMINTFNNEIAYSPQPAFYIENIEQYIFDYLYFNYQYVDSILIADNYARQIAGNSTSNLYVGILWEKTANPTNKLFANASNAFASLLFTAWVNAGRPQLNESSEIFAKENGPQLQLRTGGVLKRHIKIAYSLPGDTIDQIFIYNNSGKLLKTFNTSCVAYPKTIKWYPEYKKKSTYILVLQKGTTYFVKRTAI